MSSNSKNDPESTGYEVGYGKPPMQTRFKAGQSGNPTGKKKTNDLIKDINVTILKEAYRMMPAHEGRRTIKIPLVQAVIRGVAVLATKGNASAQRTFITIVREAENQQNEAFSALLKDYLEFQNKAKTTQQKGSGTLLRDDHQDESQPDHSRLVVEFIEPLDLNRTKASQSYEDQFLPGTDDTTNNANPSNDKKIKAAR